MRREEFFERLFRELNSLSQEEQNRIREYYMELLLDKIEEGQPEEQVIEEFGNPEEIADRIRGEQEIFQEAGRMQLEQKESGAGEPGIYEPKQPIDSFEVSAQDTSVRLYPSRDGRFRVIYHKHECEIVTVREENGCFRFCHEIPLLSRIFSFWKIGSPGIVVEVPEKVIRRFRIVTSNSSVKAEGITNFEDGYIGSSNAKISVQRFTGGRLECRTSNSSVAMDDCVVRHLEVTTSNGGITTGRCAGESVRLKTSNSRIDVGQMDYADIWLKTSNGGLKGNIMGNIRDYAIDSGTSNGSNNLPSWGDNQCTRKLYAHTSNAAIKINFG